MKKTVTGFLLLIMLFGASNSFSREINGYKEAHKLLLNEENGFLPKTTHKDSALLITGNLINGNSCSLRVEANSKSYTAELSITGDQNSVVFHLDLNDTESFTKETHTDSSMIYIDQEHSSPNSRQILSVEILGKEHGLTKRRISIENPDFMGFGGKSIVGCEVLYDVESPKEESNN